MRGWDQRCHGSRLAALLAVRGAGVLVLCPTGAACAPAAFVCTSDAQCNDGDVCGECQPNGYCSAPDPECPEGQRYVDESDPAVAGQCVVNCPDGLGVVRDAFDAGDLSPDWSTHMDGGQVAQNGGAVRITVQEELAEASFGSKGLSFVGCQVFVQLWAPFPEGTPATSYFALIDLGDLSRVEIVAEQDGTHFRFWASGNTPQQVAEVVPTGTSPWWRLRERGGFTYWDVSSDGLCWTNHAKVDDDDIPFVRAPREILLGGQAQETLAEPQETAFDNVNVLPR